MNRFLGILIFTGILLGGCTAPVNMIRTAPVGQDDSLSATGYVYSLPRTVIRVEAEIIMTRTIRGPFYRFAERYMGIRNVPQESSISWDLGGFRLEAVTESDPGAYFMIRPVSGNPDLFALFTLEKEGLLIDMHQPAGTPRLLFSPPKTQEGIYFKNVSVHSNVLRSSDTLYKTILTDSSFIKVPVLQDQLIVRTIDEKAREAADLIFKLRKRRFHMITANYDFMPEGDAMEHVLRELEDLEEEYLSLFIGKKIVEREVLHFYFIPGQGMETDRFDLFEFSPGNGITGQPVQGSGAVSLSISPEGKTDILSNRWGGVPGVLSNAVYYRIPDMAEVHLTYGSRTLIRDRIPVCQYGALLSLPLQLED